MRSVPCALCFSSLLDAVLGCFWCLGAAICDAVRGRVVAETGCTKSTSDHWPLNYFVILELPAIDWSGSLFSSNAFRMKSQCPPLVSFLFHLCACLQRYSSFLLVVRCLVTSSFLLPETFLTTLFDIEFMPPTIYSELRWATYSTWQDSVRPGATSSFLLLVAMTSNLLAMAST